VSVLHVYTLACDGADGACEATLATVENRAEHARTVAAGKGWAHAIVKGARVDMCPRHAKAVARG
jgi:hypothetical protein